MTKALKVNLCGAMARRTIARTTTAGTLMSPITLLTTKTVCMWLIKLGELKTARRSTVTSARDQKVQLLAHEITIP